MGFSEQDLKAKARQAEIEDDAETACSLYVMLSRLCAKAGDMIKARTYHNKASVYLDGEKPAGMLRFMDDDDD